MRLIGFVRHGETDWNREQRLQGQQDIALSTEGYKQAQLLAAWISQSEWAWDKVISNDLVRAKETAFTITNKIGLSAAQVELDARLRERSFGKFEGMKWIDLIAYCDGEPDERKKQELGIETDASLRLRARHFWEEHGSNSLVSGGNLLVVSHGAFLRQLLHVIPGVTEPIEQLGNTSITILEEKHNHWNVIRFNSMVHLDFTND